MAQQVYLDWMDSQGERWKVTVSARTSLHPCLSHTHPHSPSSVRVIKVKEEPTVLMGNKESKELRSATGFIIQTYVCLVFFACIMEILCCHASNYFLTLFWPQTGCCRFLRFPRVQGVSRDSWKGWRWGITRATGATRGPGTKGREIELPLKLRLLL